MCNMGPDNEPFTHQRKVQNIGIIDGQTIGRVTQELKKTHI